MYKNRTSLRARLQYSTGGDQEEKEVLIFGVWENIQYSLFEKYVSKSGLLEKIIKIMRKTLAAF